MNISRRNVFGLLGSGTIAAASSAMSSTARARSYDDDEMRSGMIFTSSNALEGNELLVYARGRDGALSLHRRINTDGQGAGAGLGSQGAVTLSEDGRYIYVVNAQSSTVSVFRLTERELKLTCVTASGGLHPISVAEHDDTVYVLNDGGAGNVAGFKNVHGNLTAIAGSVQGLSAAGGTGPAQVGFSNDGDAIVISEKMTNKLTSYRVSRSGGISGKVVTASAGMTPFGFAFNRRNRLIVSEAAGGAAGASTVSSYRFKDNEPAVPVVVSAAIPDTQGAACWVAITPNGRYAYITNTASGNVSSYRVFGNGQLELIQAIAGVTGAGTAPTDETVSADGRTLFVLNSRTATLASFRIGDGGGLTSSAGIGGLPASAVGLAAN